MLEKGGEKVDGAGGLLAVEEASEGLVEQMRLDPGEYSHQAQLPSLSGINRQKQRCRHSQQHSSIVLAHRLSSSKSTEHHKLVPSQHGLPVTVQ